MHVLAILGLLALVIMAGKAARSPERARRYKRALWIAAAFSWGILILIILQGLVRP